tara:strand:- start:445 stop:1509 length:1065 start_codon:yes stop_codon:yes gene_type:complete
VAQISTVTVNSAQNSTLYSLDILPPGYESAIVVSFTSDGSATTTEIAAGLAAAVDADAAASGWFDTGAVSNVLTLTGQAPGIVVSVSSSAASASDLTIAVATAAASGGSYSFGHVVNLATFDSASGAWNVSAPAMPAAATAVLSCTHAGSASYGVQFEATNINTGAVVVPNAIAFSAGGSASATAAAAVSAIDAIYGTGATTTSVDGSTITITITSTLPNSISSVVTAPTASGGGGSESLSVTSINPAGDFLRSGVVMDYDVTPSASFGVSPTATQAGDAVSVAEAGLSVFVADPGVAVTAGAAVYVETAAGANQGRVYTASSATRYLLPGASWVQGGVTLSNGASAAVIQLSE